MRIAVGALLVVLSTSAARPQASEAEQRQACMGDAMRFCMAHVPNHQKVGACLVANRSQLTPACRQVVDGAREPRSPRR